MTTGDSRIVIGVVDTGLLPGLVDLAGNITDGWDFTDNDPVLSDTDGHGTLVASEIVGQGNNGNDLAGYCWDCVAMPVRVTRDKSVEAPPLAQGIYWAVDHGARIISISFTLNNDSAILRQAIAYAVGKGVLVIAGAGNGYGNVTAYPAAYPGVVSVAATDQSDRIYEWSTRGDWVTLAAPGCQEVTWGATGTLCGTSVAAPAVAGTAGLLWSLDPNLTADKIAQALRSTATPVAGNGGGRVDAAAAAAALGFTPPATPPSQTLPPETEEPNVPLPAIKVRKQRRLAGTLKAVQTFSLKLFAGRVDIVLNAANARRCTLLLSSDLEASFAFTPASRNRVTLPRTTVAYGGDNKLTVACSRARSRQLSPIGKRFSITVKALFQR